MTVSSEVNRNEEREIVIRQVFEKPEWNGFGACVYGRDMGQFWPEKAPYTD